LRQEELSSILRHQAIAWDWFDLGFSSEACSQAVSVFSSMGQTKDEFAPHGQSNSRGSGFLSVTLIELRLLSPTSCLFAFKIPVSCVARHAAEQMIILNREGRRVRHIFPNRPDSLSGANPRQCNNCICTALELARTAPNKARRVTTETTGFLRCALVALGSSC
jgi:hypothetical protein